jgi:hypothetical protein
MITYVLVQPANPGGDPDLDPNPRGGDPVPLSAVWILLVAGAILGTFLLNRLKKRNV